MTDMLEVNGTWLYIAETDPASLTDQMSVINSSVACVRFVRGRWMTDASELFHEWAAALQFPYYFGENWAAFDECLADLEWLQANAYVIVVLDAGYALPDDEDLLVLLKILGRVATGWSEADEFRPARPFKVILQEAPGLRADKLRNRLERLSCPIVSIPASLATKKVST